MTARCDRCETDVEHVWRYTGAGETEWLCPDCHPDMTE
jgi:hypothetical protein